jgi:hypothetical protein
MSSCHDENVNGLVHQIQMATMPNCLKAEIRATTQLSFKGVKYERGHSVTASASCRYQAEYLFSRCYGPINYNSSVPRFLPKRLEIH